jgi:hypothetical protein
MEFKAAEAIRAWWGRAIVEETFAWRLAWVKAERDQLPGPRPVPRGPKPWDRLPGQLPAPQGNGEPPA